MAAVERLARDHLVIPVERLDADPWVFNVENGTIVVDRTASETDPIHFRPHNPEDFLTKLAPVKYDPEAACPRYDLFLDEVQPSKEVQRHIHQWAGYGLTTSRRERARSLRRLAG